MVAFSGSLEAQSFNMRKTSKDVFLNVATSSIRDIRGWQYGLEIGISTKKDWSLSAFSYSNLAASENETRRYQGIQLGIPLLSLSRFSWGIDQHIGLYDQHFLATITTLKLDYSIDESVKFSSGIGVNDRYPIFKFKMIFSLR